MSEPSDDPIKPALIEHIVDEVWIEGNLEQYYNFFDYHFEQDDTYCRARSYADTMDKFTVYGPFAAGRDLHRVDHDAFERAVHAYLKRRYRTVEGR